MQIESGIRIPIFSLNSIFSVGMLVWIFFLLKYSFSEGKFQKSHLFQALAILFMALLFFTFLAVGLWLATHALS